MKNNVEPDFLSQLDAVFAQLSPQAVEEFYAAYRQWSLQQRITALRQRIDAVREQQADNEQRLRERQPSAIALAALARLQSNGVSDIALLDAMLERGESWLDQTMQRLDYFEQFDDFISDDYTKWCQGALEGAFDWIDSLRESTEQAASTQPETPPEEAPSHKEDAGDVEALLLQRLATEDEQDDLSWQESITLKRTAIQPPPQETVITASEEQIIPEEVFPVEDTTIPESEPDQPALIEFAPVEDPPPGEDELHTGDNQPALIESAPTGEPSPAEGELYAGGEQPALVEFAAPSEVAPAEEASDQAAEQTAPPEITMPEVIPTEDTDQSEVSQPDEMGNGPSEEASAHEQQAIPASERITPARSTPRKRGLIGTLIWILTGK